MKLIAHRGAGKVAPENTLKAFAQAIALGADAIELDLHETKDEKLVVHHDYSLGNPDNGSGLISESYFEYIQTLKVKDQKIPLFEEVLQLSQGKCQLEVELKGLTEPFVKRVLQVVNEYQMTDQVEFTSPHVSLLCRIKQLDATLRVGYFVPTPPPWMSDYLFTNLTLAIMTFSHFDVAHLPVKLISKELLTRLHQAKKSVHAADCNTINEMLAMKELGVDQLSTDDIRTAVSQLKL